MANINPHTCRKINLLALIHQNFKDEVIMAKSFPLTNFIDQKLLCFSEWDGKINANGHGHGAIERERERKSVSVIR